MKTLFLFLISLTFWVNGFTISPYYGTNISTTTGKADLHISGNINLAASSQTPSAFNINLDGVNGRATFTSSVTATNITTLQNSTTTLRTDLNNVKLATGTLTLALNTTAQALTALTTAVKNTTDTLRVDLNEVKVATGTLLARAGGTMTGDLQVGTVSASTLSTSGYITLANLGSAPTAVIGRIYFDSTGSRALKISLDGSNFVALSTSTGGGGTVGTEYPAWVHVTKTYVALSSGAVNNNIELYSLPAGAVIHGVKIKHSSTFTGGALSGYNISVGIDGDYEKYASLFDIFQSTSDTKFQLSDGLFSENHGSATSVKLYAVSSGANLSAATQGSVDIWLLISTAN